MAATAQDYLNSDGSQSGKNSRFYTAEEIADMLARLDVPFYLQRTFVIWWKACTAPFGREIQFFKSIPDFARAARICERTARYHVRKFERLELVEVAVTSEGKRLVQNTVRRPVTYRLRTETLVRNRWDKCARCGHNHATGAECGCDMGERRGRFRTKDGQVVSKVVHRTCRCMPAHAAPTPIRPQRSSHRSSPERPSPPAQDPAAPLASPTTADPVHVAPPQRDHTRINEPPPGSRAEKRILDLRREVLAKWDELKRGHTRHVEAVGGYGYDLSPDDSRYVAPVSPEKAWTMALMFCSVTEKEARERLKLTFGKLGEPESST